MYYYVQCYNFSDCSRYNINDHNTIMVAALDCKHKWLGHLTQLRWWDSHLIKLSDSLIAFQLCGILVQLALFWSTLRNIHWPRFFVNYCYDSRNLNMLLVIISNCQTQMNVTKQMGHSNFTPKLLCCGSVQHYVVFQGADVGGGSGVETPPPPTHTGKQMDVISLTQYTLCNQFVNGTCSEGIHTLCCLYM